VRNVHELKSMTLMSEMFVFTRMFSKLRLRCMSPKLLRVEIVVKSFNRMIRNWFSLIL